jgi:hypothetical protein
MKSCQWCEEAFFPKVKYQIYCQVSCREEATRQKIADRYQMSRRKKLMSKKRSCLSCGLPLSAYNDDKICNSCLINPKEVKMAIKELRGLMDE